MQDFKIDKVVKAAFLLAIAIVFQFLGRNIPGINQFLVGPVVNAVLILATFICGSRLGALVAVLTPILAWIVGQLATAMAPFIPFIVVGNLIYILTFSILKNKKHGLYIGIILGSFIKFAFLSFSASNILKAIDIGIPKKILEKLAVSMGIPQLITALAGGIIAIILIKLLYKRKAI
ncbi:ECF transporter S component [Clostridium folliculivorans]|uniref:ECF transporter S component n=1 Tax=Clostridium folliculivorans TaxID=2886038 RepID=A0A9W5Y710_9CLOT|nr:ECF transporter S component [Clostridium folliculivorans]GKU27653.1 hypothetical protein CFOLD11_44800 [Clostridium folliculivorans]GKU32416.1 hypothetical protein CFB3_45240 [Clostridium folliculivorans]